ncbi:MAG: DUF190 domain-containing protein [Legionellaceae bacterium]|nr:DUF190 domain-containing protein [Legionellaceae bacterium]
MSLEITKIVIARIYLTESSPMLDDILDYLRGDADIRGFSVFRAVRGFGDTGEQASRLIDVSLNLPLIIEFFDEEAKSHRIIEHLTQFVKPKHIVFWDAQTNKNGT